MSRTEENKCILMAREDLAGIPSYPLKTGYSIRPYAKGDDRTWIHIQSAAEQYSAVTPQLFRSEFGDDEGLLRSRMLFLTDPSGRDVGTATAWFDEGHHGQPYGRIHWVAIHPDSQGQGLSKPLLTRTCQVLAELGHSRTYLVTSTKRIPAISLYRRFDFVPEINTPEDVVIWEQLRISFPDCCRLDPCR